MVTQVMTRQEFYQKYPSFASLAWGSPERERWLAAHPGAAAQWSAIREVEQQMASRYGEDWRTNDSASYDRWLRTVADYLDGGFAAPTNTAPGTSTNPTGPAPTTPPPSQGQGEPTYDRNAYQLIKGVYDSYGLGSLAPKILEYAQQGYTNDTIEILIRDTDEFRKRFAANEIRRKAGLNVLSIGQYLALENEYAAILQGSGLPTGFYDNKEEDFANWIAGDVAPDELRERVLMAQRAVMTSDPSVKQQLAAYYNLGEGDLVAYFLDPKRATTLFDTRRVFGSAVIGSEASKQGLTVSKDRALLFADQGVSQDAARQGFANVATALPDAERLSSIYDGADVGQTELEDEFLTGNAAAQKARTQLVGKEAANFSGSSGLMKSTLRKRKRGAY
jgi:hypothetical protein